jgi:hypothetical protein
VYVLIGKGPAGQLSATVNLDARSLPKTLGCMIAHTFAESVCSDKRSLLNCWCGVMYNTLKKPICICSLAVESGLQVYLFVFQH